MKRLMLAAVLAAPLFANAAQWAKVASASDSEFYIDKSSILKSGQGHKAWSLVSHAKEQTTPDGKPYRSMKALDVYSCAERTTTARMQVFYAEPMGKGALVQSIKYMEFSAEDIVPDSGYDGALQVICRKK